MELDCIKDKFNFPHVRDYYIWWEELMAKQEASQETVLLPQLPYVSKAIGKQTQPSYWHLGSLVVCFLASPSASKAAVPSVVPASDTIIKVGRDVMWIPVQQACPILPVIDEDISRMGMAQVWWNITHCPSQPWLPGGHKDRHLKYIQEVVNIGNHITSSSACHRVLTRDQRGCTWVKRTQKKLFDSLDMLAFPRMARWRL